MFGTYVALRTIMVERSGLLPNIKALYINSLVPPCDCSLAEDNAQQPCLLLCTFLFTSNIRKKRRDQCIFANSIA